MTNAERTDVTTRLPAEVSARLLADGDAIARRLARRLADEITMPAEFRSRPYLRAVVRASRDGLLALLRQLHDGGRPEPAELAELGRAGARQAELGVPLEVLLSGYRLAAKVVWREVVDEATRLGELPPATVVALSEQVLEYLDGISGAVGSAYLETRERLVRQRDRERDRLLQRLLAGDVSPELRRLAATHDLDLTPPFWVLAVGGVDPVEAERLTTTAWHAARPLLAPDEPGMWIALVPARADVDALAASAAEAVPSVQIGAGPAATSLEQVAAAARRARAALRAGTRLDPERRLHLDRDLGVVASLLDQPDRLRDHVTHVLGPLVGNGGQRHRDLLATLDVVVSSRGLGEAAARLHVHRHTVVYRIDRLRELLGVDLDDPEERHRLWLALQGLRLLGGDGVSATAP